VNKNHSGQFTWYLEEDGPWVNKPSGKGPRLIIVHAMRGDHQASFQDYLQARALEGGV
jgi:hypothetical protein